MVCSRVCSARERVVGDDVEDGADVHRAVGHPRGVLDDAVGVGLVVGVELRLRDGRALGDPGRAVPSAPGSHAARARTDGHGAADTAP